MRTHRETRRLRGERGTPAVASCRSTQRTGTTPHIAEISMGTREEKSGADTWAATPELETPRSAHGCPSWQIWRTRCDRRNAGAVAPAPAEVASYGIGDAQRG